MAGTCSWIGRFFFDSSHFFSMISFSLTKIKMFQRLGTIGWKKNHTKYENRFYLFLFLFRGGAESKFLLEKSLVRTKSANRLFLLIVVFVWLKESVFGSEATDREWEISTCGESFISALLWDFSWNRNRNPIRGVESYGSSVSVKAQGRDREEDREISRKRKVESCGLKTLSPLLSFLSFSLSFLFFCNPYRFGDWEVAVTDGCFSALILGLKQEKNQLVLLLQTCYSESSAITQPWKSSKLSFKNLFL